MCVCVFVCVGVCVCKRECVWVVCVYVRVFRAPQALCDVRVGFNDGATCHNRATTIPHVYTRNNMLGHGRPTLSFWLALSVESSRKRSKMATCFLHHFWGSIVA